MSLPTENENKGPEVTIHLENNSPTLGKSTAYAHEDFRSSRNKTGLERRLVWKMDLLIVPLLALIYFVSFLVGGLPLTKGICREILLILLQDRNSLGNGRIMGLQKSLKMSNQDYYNCAQLFFIGYVAFMLPGNILIRKIPPNFLLGGAVVFFGIFLCCMSAAQNTATVLAMRILIGSAQAFVQGVGLYGSLWWKRDEAATRGAIYFSASTLSGAFSGLIAYGIGRNLSVEATRRAPWRWLFLIEGVIAIVVGVVVVLLLPPFPDKMKNGENWLFTKEEIDFAIERSSTFNTKDSKVQWKQIWVCLKDPKSWAYAFMNGGISLALSSIGVFLPTFVKDFGFSVVRAQLFTVIPYAFAAVSLPLLCLISDRINVKGPFIILALSSSCIGYIVLLTVNSVAVKVVGTCLIASGLYPAVVLTVTWLAINTGGFTKRGTTWALAEIVGQCFSIMGSNVYKGAPRYIQGHSIVLAFLAFAIVNTCGLLVWMNHLNKKKDVILAELADRHEIHHHAERSLEDEYDFHINFRYIL